MSKLTNFKTPTDYKVGYGKPPKSGQFKKGQSGNPNGRPRGARNKGPKSLNTVRDLIIKEGQRKVTIEDKDGPTTISVMEATLRTLGINAAKGDVRAQRLFLEVTSKAEADALDERMATFDTFVAYKKEKLAVLRDYRERGQTPPAMLPHPDDIKIDYETGEVTFHGPVNEDDLEIWGRLHSWKENLEEEIGQMQKELETLKEGDEHSIFLAEEIESHQYHLITICLQIIRRWKLPIYKVLSRHTPLDQYLRHVNNGTDPTPPAKFKKLVETLSRK